MLRPTKGADTHRAVPAHSQPVGALVVGGDHPGLGIARSLGRRGFPVYLIDDQPCISYFSKYAARVVRFEDLLDEKKTVEAILEVGRRFKLHGWVLFPTRDEHVAAFSRHRSELAEIFIVTTGEWESIQWAWDKGKTYELCEKLGIPHPRTFVPKTEAELGLLKDMLPLALKPAIKENFFYATGAKAWRANTPEELYQLYARAARQIRTEEILVQELIPGDGQEQYSYCAFVRNGQPHSILTARRARQHPREFGRAATYVETISLPVIEELSERFLRAIQYHGLVEIEFKRDPRDGQYKLLDVNARPWGFHSIGSACGVDFPYLAFADAMGIHVEGVRGEVGVGWLRFVTDLPTALSDLMGGHLGLIDYFKTLRATRIESVFSWKDPFPAIAEFLLLPYMIAKKYPLLQSRKV